MFWNKAKPLAQKALKNGQLLPIAAQSCMIEQQGVNYTVYVKNTAHCQLKFASKPSDFNPFLPFESAMYVADAGSEHVCLLNKYPVLDAHLLICSKQFIPQTQLLSINDFTAWNMGLVAEEDLGFYNGGPMAGASQSHRHMQLIKTSLTIEDKITAGQLPFPHQVFQYDHLEPERLFRDYQLGIQTLNNHQVLQPKPYNLLLTKRWLLIIPRSRHQMNGIFTNGLNYAGHFVLNEVSQLAWLKNYGFMEFLTTCCR